MDSAEKYVRGYAARFCPNWTDADLQRRISEERQKRLKQFERFGDVAVAGAFEAEYFANRLRRDEDTMRRHEQFGTPMP